MTENVVSTNTDPETAAALVQDLFRADTPMAPVIEPPAPGFVTLPGGLAAQTNPTEAVYEAEVRELTGADEEYVDRVRRGKPAKTNEAILEKGVVSIGGNAAPRHVIRNLLLGDALKLLLEIRRATYGDLFEYENLTCPHCRELFNLNLEIDDIPEHKLDNTMDRFFEVPLRRKKVAHVRLPRMMDVPDATDDMTSAEYNTLLLSTLVLSIEDKATGAKDPVAGSPDAARRLGTADRQSILKELGKRKVGPDLDAVKFTHDMCGQEVPFPLSVGDLFPGL